MLEESQCWKVSGVRTAEDFFRAVSVLVPDATHMFLEGSPSPDIAAVLESAADGDDYTPPAGTLWSWPRKARRRSVRTSAELLGRLSEMASNHAEPEICDHVHFYRGQEPLVQWFEAFGGPMFISKSVPLGRVEQFASAVAGALSDGAA